MALRSVVCDAGGLLAASGALVGAVPGDSEFLALDWTSITVGRLMAARFEGRDELIEAEIGFALAMVAEWFPVRTIMAVTLRRAGNKAVDALDSWSSLILAERLGVALFTASDEVTSMQIEIIRPW